MELFYLPGGGSEQRLFCVFTALAAVACSRNGHKPSTNSAILGLCCQRQLGVSDNVDILFAVTADKNRLVSKGVRVSRAEEFGRACQLKVWDMTDKLVPRSHSHSTEELHLRPKSPACTGRRSAGGSHRAP